VAQTVTSRFVAHLFGRARSLRPGPDMTRQLSPYVLAAAAPAEADLMTNRPMALATVVAAAAVIETMLGPKAAPRFVWNVSGGVPTGLYQAQPARDLIVTALVVVYPPEPLPFLNRGRRLPAAMYDLSSASRASRSDRVPHRPNHCCPRHRNGCGTRARPLRTRASRLGGCHTLARDEAFLMNCDKPTSLDGRYFGPIPLHPIVGRDVPLRTFEED
jgi:type IV secretory pathway protease TraF